MVFDENNDAVLLFWCSLLVGIMPVSVFRIHSIKRNGPCGGGGACYWMVKDVSLGVCHCESLPL